MSVQQQGYDELKNLKSIASIKSPTLTGTEFLARVIYVIDADTVVVARLVGTSCALRYKIRICSIDTPEIIHGGSSKTKTSEFENALGCKAKSTVLNAMLPNEFEVCDKDVYDWRKQQKIFESHPVIVRIKCPTHKTTGKVMDKDPYGRELGHVYILSDGDRNMGVDVGQFLIDAKLADFYEGGTKLRSFITSTESSSNCLVVEETEALRHQHVRDTE